MIRTLIIFFALLFVFIFNLELYSQADTDTNTVITINSDFVSQDTIIFEFEVRRFPNQMWTNWANSTFMIDFNDDVDFDNIGIIPHEDQSGIPFKDPTNPSFGKYIEKIIISDDRIAFGFLGPETFDETIYIPEVPNPGVIVGRYKLFTLDGSSFPLTAGEGVRLTWKTPTEYYQDFAYKTYRNIDSLSVQDWFVVDDNVRMGYPIGFTTYIDDNTDRPRMVLDYFNARYMGGLNVELTWATLSEAFNRGFYIKRGLMPFTTNDVAEVDFDIDVANFRQVENVLTMTGLGTRVPGKEYAYRFDTVSSRGLTYCYELLYEDFAGDIHSLATSCLTIPNAVLTYLQGNPNPFAKQTQVEYIVEDDVYLTAEVYDLTGRKMMTLINDEFIPMGKHTFDLTMPDMASNGLYDLVLIAVPINDRSVEKSRGVFKLQLIK